MIFAVIMNILIKAIAPLAFLALSFRYFTLAAFGYIGFLALFSMYVMVMEANRPHPDPNIWDEFEIHVIRRYHVALKYPRVANDIACQISGHQAMAWIWIPWFLYHRFWVGPVVLLAFHFLIGPKQAFLAPGFHLPRAIKRGCEWADNELETLIQVQDRMSGA